jgi:hypothetical protein
MSARVMPLARFRLGRIMSTPTARDQLTQADILRAIGRHQAGDWGDVSESDRQQNELALKQGGRLWSVYHAANHRKFWLITEANRASTVVLMPEDY